MVHELALLGPIVGSVREQSTQCFIVEQLEIEQENQVQTPSIFGDIEQDTKVQVCKTPKFKFSNRSKFKLCVVFAVILCNIHLIR